MSTNQMTVVHREVKFDEENTMQVSLERELEILADDELSYPKVEGPQIDVQRVATYT